MDPHRANPDSDQHRPDLPRTQLYLLLALFVGSGGSALIYQIVWFQLLQLVIGSSAISLGVLLGTFMGGMCLGSLYLARLVDARRHPLRVYAWLEFGIAACGLGVLYLIPLVGGAYALVGGQGMGGVAMRALMCAICLLPPTLLMGATLPAIARWVRATPSGAAWLGYFYGGNTVGAVLGCLLAGFYLLPRFDMPTATHVAVAVNIAVAALALALSEKARYLPMPDAGMAGHGAAGPGRVHLAIALSGLSALGAEVIWTRELSLLLGGSTYTFSIILAVFLLGIGLGSAVAARLVPGIADPRRALGLCQLLLVLAIAWAAFSISRSLPFWPVVPGVVSSPWYLFQLDLVRSVYAVLPAACLWGASFPLALAAASDRHSDPGRTVGKVYAANTVGAIVGALVFSIVVIPVLGTQQGQRLLLLTATVAAALLLLPAVRSLRAGLMTLAAAGACALLMLAVAPLPFEMVAFGRATAISLGRVDELYRGEGMNSTVAVSQQAGNPAARYFHVAGKVEASSVPQDMRLQAMLGNLPALAHPDPKSVLVVGFGAGVTAGSFVPYPSLERLVICEMEALVPQVVSTWFETENQAVARDPRVQIVNDDARHYVRTTREQFDIITSDPIHPWVRGAAALYTQDYFEHVRARLKPGGIVTQWIPLYESSEEVVKSEIASFLAVFPHATVWGNVKNGRGFDAVIMGSVEPLAIDVDALAARVERPDHARVAAALATVGYDSPVALLSTYAGDADDLAPWVRDAQINRDRNLRLQYLAGMSSTRQQSDAIYQSILAFRNLPASTLTGDGDAAQTLRAALAAPATPTP